MGGATQELKAFRKASTIHTPTTLALCSNTAVGKGPATVDTTDAGLQYQTPAASKGLSDFQSQIAPPSITRHYFSCFKILFHYFSLRYN